MCFGYCLVVQRGRGVRERWVLFQICCCISDHMFTFFMEKGKLIDMQECQECRYLPLASTVDILQVSQSQRRRCIVCLVVERAFLPIVDPSISENGASLCKCPPVRQAIRCSIYLITIESARWKFPWPQIAKNLKSPEKSPTSKAWNATENVIAGESKS